LRYGASNTGQTVNGIAGIEDADIDAPEAWDIETGVSHPVVIAVVDTGVAYHHPDLEANIWRNTAENCDNGIDDDGNGYIDDCHGWDFIGNDNDPPDYNNYLGGIGHGSHVAGTIAAAGNNHTGITGVMWQAQIMPLRTLGVTGAGTTAAAIAAIEYANANGAQVINNSWGGIGFSQALKDVIDQSNAVVVCAAGNESQDNDLNPTYPASFTSPNIISVAATTSSDNLAFFSNYGHTSVDVAAPGVFTFSTMPVYSMGVSERVYRENFDEPDASLERLGWITGERSSFSSLSTWEVAPNQGGNGNSLEDSLDGDYKNNTSSWVGYTNSGIPLRSAKDNLYTLEFQWKGALEQDRDFLEINASIDSVSWDPIDQRSGTVSNFTKDFSTELTLVADIVDEFYF
jgi:hypothetical protein